MPYAILPFNRAEKKRWAHSIGAEIRASLPWWHLAERVRIGFIIDSYRLAA